MIEVQLLVAVLPDGRRCLALPLLHLDDYLELPRYWRWTVELGAALYAARPRGLTRAIAEELDALVLDARALAKRRAV